jgi:hypothetical protein
MRATSGASGAATDRQVSARSSAARALLEAMPVRQWPKDGLVVAAPPSPWFLTMACARCLSTSRREA